ncbi:bifunctional diguanylate cyclase/phosphodiesterase [Azonexus hydrophilus]|uniref:bifunctional diguanylate cyclase/phosphodiesterase n=1 Tax=Azonexus hydrophilus TaxID=418702 RepID=UPI0009FB4887|nr:EAL domain-containing protein [Azonexus hydrophilus]
MTLRRQLFLGISVIFLGVFIGLAILGVSGTRTYLEEQLGSHAQDAASSLVHPLSQSIGAGDRILADTQVATLFDRGYFQRIAVLGTDGAVVLGRELPAKIDGVPLWFSSRVTLDAPPGEAFLIAGWRQLGKVVVVSQPTHAYQYLWKSALEISGWMLLAYLLALWMTRMVLHWILNPLSEIERSAMEIQQKHFGQIAIKPKALELSRVVGAMNEMSRKISEFLDAESRRAEQFRREAYQDDLTGLDNRRSFELRLTQALDGDIPFSDAALIGVEVNNLKSFNTEASYRQGDQFLVSVATAARSILGDQAAILCRTSGSSFGFVLFDRDPAMLADLGRQLRDSLQQVFPEQEGDADFSFSIGMVHFRHGEKRARLMSRLDLAIESARQSGRNALQYVVDVNSSESGLGSMAWRELIRNALAENRWTLLGQPVVSLSSGQVMQQEIMTRLIGNDGNLVPASVFLPMAMRHKLMPDIDQALLSLVFRRLEERGEGEVVNLAVNLSNQSLENREFLAWLSGRLSRLSRRGVQLSFELTEYGCSLDMESSRQFADMLRTNQVRFGIDHFGLTPTSLQLLRELPPDYVKLDAGLVAEAPENEAARALLRSIVSLASTLEVEVIAQGVETLAQVEMLLSDSVKGGQGYHFGAPSADRI